MSCMLCALYFAVWTMSKSWRCAQMQAPCAQAVDHSPPTWGLVRCDQHSSPWLYIVLIFYCLFVFILFVNSSLVYFRIKQRHRNILSFSKKKRITERENAGEQHSTAMTVRVLRVSLKTARQAANNNYISRVMMILIKLPVWTYNVRGFFFFMCNMILIDWLMIL